MYIIPPNHTGITPFHKRRLYVGVVLPILLYGCESCRLDSAGLHKLAMFHHYCVRVMCGINRRHTYEKHITTDSLLRRLRLQPIEYYLRRRQLRWYGEIARMPLDRLPRRIFSAVPIAEPETLPCRARGRQRPTLSSAVAAALGWAKIPLAQWPDLARRDAAAWTSRVNSVHPLKLPPPPLSQHHQAAPAAAGNGNGRDASPGRPAPTTDANSTYTSSTGSQFYLANNVQNIPAFLDAARTTTVRRSLRLRNLPPSHPPIQ